MLDLITPISDADFGELIEYMKTKCNIVSFRVPHFNKFIITENNIAYHKYCLRPNFNNVGDVLLIEPTDKVFTEYKENTRGLIASLEGSIIKNYLSEKYINQVHKQISDAAHLGRLPLSLGRGDLMPCPPGLPSACRGCTRCWHPARLDGNRQEWLMLFCA